MICYGVVAKEYSYFIVKFSYNFNLWRCLASTSLLAILLIASYRIKDELLYFLYFGILTLLFLGEAVCFVFCDDGNPATLIGASLLLFFLIILQNIKIKTKQTIIKRDPLQILLIIAIILFIPFFIEYHDKINLNNLFLSDIYETRTLFRELGNGNHILGYITSPLSRVILPALMALSIKNKKYSYLIICAIMILFVFLCGALKSILFGLFATLIFYGGTCLKKTKRLLSILVVALAIGLIAYVLFKNIGIIDIFRRVFFVPPRLNSLYANYFQNRPDFLSHSPLGLGLTKNEYGSSLSMFFGRNVLGSDSGINANVGLIAEGFISFNYIGLILFSLLTATIFQFFRWIKIDRIFAGIILVYVYYVNTSFLSTLLLTHGLFFLIIFSYLFMRKVEKAKNEQH